MLYKYGKRVLDVSLESFCFSYGFLYFGGNFHKSTYSTRACWIRDDCSQLGREFAYDLVVWVEFSS